MSGGFTNSTVGAQGSLTRSQIKSPDFNQSSQTGWAILKNGNAYFFNITASGEITANQVEIVGSGGFAIVKNAFGAVVMQLTSAGFFQYFDNESAVQGALILSIASVAGNDPVNGTPYPVGLYGVDPAFGDTLNVIGSNIILSAVGFTSNAGVDSATGSGSVGPYIVVNAPEEGSAGHSQMQLYGESPDGTVPPGIVFSQAQTGNNRATRMTSAPVEIQESDGNIYTAGESTKQVPSGGLTINQTTFSQAVVPAWSVAKGGTYDFEAQLWYTTGAAAGSPEFQVAGTATASLSAFDFEARLTGQASTGSLVGSLTAYGTTMTGPAMTASGVTYVMYIRGSATFSAAGTFRFQAATTVAADTFTILAGSKATLSRTG
jgi:hypothetical protein